MINFFSIEFATFFVLALILPFTLAAGEKPNWKDDDGSHDDKARFNQTRMDMMNCTLAYIDRNHDGYVSEEEMEWGRQNLLSWYERPWAEDTETIMRNCDFDRDGRISRSDMELSYSTCLNTEKKLSEFNKYICKRAKDKASKH